MLTVISCKKDNVTNIHQGLTRIDYDINNPLEMPCIEFAFENTHNLTNHTLMSVSLKANELTANLHLKILLEDSGGHQTDVSPFIIQDTDLIKDNQLHSYTYDFRENLGSSTSISSEINISGISKVIIYINSGLSGSVAEGTFWLDNIQMEESD